ncbi:efflux transporter outer membrane subunit [Massilia arenosa]|uniref:Efflux transporter outer membrane subunit n=1 Tax=Zemynaea arenosa TaxID=2561931 RepID=A0A4Y9SMS7_9BURK|nr:efflux transporter outer membrane subunit [Massilia arenosa]TFW26225.1 efflux transporter outer membrane subunit [Massilia arenosa]
MKNRHRLTPLAQAALLATAALTSACSLTPTYHTPTTPQPAAFKEAGDWVPAAPADALERGPWWRLFNDPTLDSLMAQVDVSNQNVAAAVASYEQARALVQEARAAFFPAVSLNGSANRSGGGGSNSNGSSYRLSLGGTWEPDVWGRLRASSNAASASAQASAADLASARLSAQGELAANYFSLRAADAQRALLGTTIEGYQRVLQITQNRFNAGIAAKSDVLQAQTQLANAQSDALTLDRQRAQLEHAIAVLVGKAPADFALAPDPAWRGSVPAVPVGVPSTLLQRRPDIASAERRVAAANEQIGIARAGYYPNIGLTASYGTGGTAVSDLFKASTAVWSLGLSAAQLIFDAGETRARVAGARAAQEEAAARYRQTVLTAFADVEDQLSAARILAQQEELQRQASAAADQVEQQMLNRYKAGQVSYTEVVQAQATALAARRALVQSQSSRQSTAVALIQSLGGGWQGL